MKIKKKLLLIPSAYNAAAMGDIENFIDFYKDDFEVFVIVDREIPGEIETLNGINYVDKNTRTKTYLEITADYIIDAGAVPGNNKLSNIQKRISVWHGTPYKKMFVDLDRKHAITAIDYASSFDLMVSPSKWYSERFLRQSMLYEGDILETGVSRTDSLFLSEEEKNKIKREFGIARDKKVLMYAPTFREKGEFRIPFSAETMKRVLGPDWVIVVKAHYINTLSNPEGIIDATNYPTINNLLAITDLMITDYSSVLFDYSVLGKPAVLYQYDREEYEKNRSFMFDMEDYVERDYIVRSEEELYELLLRNEQIGDNLKSVRENFYPHQKANATSELVEKLDLDSSRRGLKEVVFLVNDLNEIGGVHSFILNLAKEFKRRYSTKIYVIGLNEYNADKESLHQFDEDNIIDIKISLESNPGSVRAILDRTDGYIIACQYSAQLAFQYYLDGKKTCLMFHGDTKDIVDRTLYSWHLDAINKGRLNNYKKLVFLSDANCDVIRPHVKEDIRDTIITMENGFDFSDSKNLYSESGDFVLVSRLDADKNPMEAINIFASDKLNPKYKLHIYGTGSLQDEIKCKAAELGIEDRIILHGYEEDKEVIYNGKQGLISVSLSEGLPYTFLEAAKYGIPIYTYGSFTSCKDLVDESNGVIIETGNTEAFAESLNHPFEMGRFSNEKITKRFSDEEVVDRWEALFNEMEDADGTSRDTDSSQLNIIDRSQNGSITERLKYRIRKSRLFDGNEKYAELSVKWRAFKNFNRKTDTPLVSIVMPFYNNNDTIVQAVRSVEKSGYANYEIILVNDGSKQDPRTVLGKRKRIKYYYKENGGLSSTRNYAFDKASGKYLFFLDSDDTLYPGGLSRLVSFAEKHKLEMVCGKTVRHYVNTKEEEYWYPNIYSRSYVNDLKNRRKIIDDTISTAKLYSRKMIMDGNVRFEDGLYEDVLFTGQLYATLERIGVVDGITQKWMIYGNNTSITTARTFDSAIQRLDKVDKVFKKQTKTINKLFYTRQYIRHQMIAAIAGWNEYSEEQKHELYLLLKEGMSLRREYAVEKLQPTPSKRVLYKSLLEDDYATFDLLATGFSAEQTEEGDY